MKRTSYICAGLIVRDIKSNKIGKVIVVDRTTKQAIMRDEGSYWTQRFNELEVASYREVE